VASQGETKSVAGRQLSDNLYTLLIMSKASGQLIWDYDSRHHPFLISMALLARETRQRHIHFHPIPSTECNAHLVFILCIIPIQDNIFKGKDLFSRLYIVLTMTITRSESTAPGRGAHVMVLGDLTPV
jgi:hypothetical protein